MNDVMIDIETMDTKPSSIVLSIGAVKFCLKTGRLGDEFHRVLNIQEQIDVGRTLSASTLQWWMKQSREAKEVFLKPQYGVLDVLNDFTEYFQKEGTLFVWGNGASFDPVIIDNLYRSFKKQSPWQYWNVMDVRTIKRFLGKNDPIKNLGITHNALDDSIAQAKYVINKIRNRK